MGKENNKAMEKCALYTERVGGVPRSLICIRALKPGTTSLALERAERYLLLRRVPADKIYWRIWPQVRTPGISDEIRLYAYVDFDLDVFHRLRNHVARCLHLHFERTSGSVPLDRGQLLPLRQYREVKEEQERNKTG